MRLLILNAGSSSLKVSRLDDEVELRAETVPVGAGGIDDDVLRSVIDRAGAVDAVGHRVVHGGREFIEPVVVDDRVLRRLRELVSLAPLHQPAALRTIELSRQLLPAVPHVACFDTAFHAHLPDAAATYALPSQWRERWDIRRYGFHGLSHAHVTRTVTASVKSRSPNGLRIVSCHLGAGASLAAVGDGVSVDTTMGFTPLEGLPMATRSGSVDPGLLLWLIQQGDISPGELSDALEHRSGVLGLAGSADMAEVLDGADRGDPNAALAVSVYVHRLRASIAAMVAAMGGLDAIAFTGGVGENASVVRARAADGLGFLGIALDPLVNASARGDADIGAAGAVVRAFVVTAREDVEISRGMRRALNA